MIVTSRMSGTSSIVVRPGASSAAAISLRALFFAPVTRTRPVRAVPPVTSKHSTQPPYGGPAGGSHRELKVPVLLIPRRRTASSPPLASSRRDPRGGRASGRGRGQRGPSSTLAPMTVRLTRIYTKTGDAGQTHLGDMSRVAKTDPRLVAYADVDETNSSLGVALALGAPSAARAELLRSVQNDLFDVGADLSTPVQEAPEHPPLRITPAYTERLAGGWDGPDAELPALTSFVLPGGTPLAALLHAARTVARRAERSVWALLEVEAERTNAETARYLNRLSDLLFILARAANPDGDVLWEPGGHSGAHAQQRK